MSLTPVVFLDRDGVLIRDGDYLFDPSKVVLIPGAAHAVAELRAAGFLVVCVSNQSGVGRNKIGASIFSVDACNRRMQELLHQENPLGSFLDIRYSPHDDEDKHFRKPATGLIEPIAPWVDLHRSFFVGDRATDLECGINLGLPREHCIRVKTGKPNLVPGYPEVADIVAAKDIIMRQMRNSAR